VDVAGRRQDIGGRYDDAAAHDGAVECNRRRRKPGRPAHVKRVGRAVEVVKVRVDVAPVTATETYALLVGTQHRWGQLHTWKRILVKGSTHLEQQIAVVVSPLVEVCATVCPLGQTGVPDQKLAPWAYEFTAEVQPGAKQELVCGKSACSTGSSEPVA
jgi:hypothetical protein